VYHKNIISKGRMRLNRKNSDRKMHAQSIYMQREREGVVKE